MAKEALTLDEAEKALEEIRKKFPCKECFGSGLLFDYIPEEGDSYASTCAPCDGSGYDHDAYVATL